MNEYNVKGSDYVLFINGKLRVCFERKKAINDTDDSKKQ